MLWGFGIDARSVGQQKRFEPHKRRNTNPGTQRETKEQNGENTEDMQEHARQTTHRSPTNLKPHP